jgi:hypothetical protein
MRSTTVRQVEFCAAPPTVLSASQSTIEAARAYTVTVNRTTPGAGSPVVKRTMPASGCPRSVAKVTARGSTSTTRIWMLPRSGSEAVNVTPSATSLGVSGSASNSIGISVVQRSRKSVSNCSAS